MSDTVKIILADENKTEYVFSRIISFKFTKNIFVPYTSFNAVFCCDEIFLKSVSYVKLLINDNEIHVGFIDTLKSYEKNGCFFISLVSKGFTAVMLQNYLAAGLYPDISFNSLMENYISMPYVTHENNSEKSGYIYVSENKSFWDSVCSFGYKLKKNIPYISGTNKVNISIPKNPEIIVLKTENITEKGRTSDYRAILSDIYMQDAAGEYGKYHLHSDKADTLNISRRMNISLDRQFLYSPDSALVYRMQQYFQKEKLFYVKSAGFAKAELYDVLQDGNSIKAIEIIGDKKGIFTLLYN